MLKETGSIKEERRNSKKNWNMGIHNSLFPYEFYKPCLMIETKMKKGKETSMDVSSHSSLKVVKCRYQQTVINYVCVLKSYSNHYKLIQRAILKNGANKSEWKTKKCSGNQQKVKKGKTEE